MKKHGSCLCGAVTYETVGELRPVLACHCVQCRKQTGHYLASTNSKDVDFRLLTSDSLKWYRASDFAARGFCGTCGSVLFWKRDGADTISISAGSIDGPTGLKLDGHIYCAYAGDYYEITGGDYQLPEWQ
jgi:hypothetical protein